MTASIICCPQPKRPWPAYTGGDSLRGRAAEKFFSYTPCFRREAGSHRADERGMVRGHQFNKVEMFQYTRPEDSDAAFDELVAKAENLVKGLGFHFRTVKLAAGDCSSSMARTYDIEIQIPSMNGYKEVSSVSNARDYQARRGNIRFRREATGQDGIRPHPQRLRPGDLPDLPGHGRAKSKGRRLCGGTGGLEKVPGRLGSNRKVIMYRGTGCLKIEFPLIA